MTKHHEAHDAPGVAAPTGVVADLQIEQQQEVLLQAWACLYSPKSVLYVSGPMTTGRRFVDWYSSMGRSFRVNSRRYNAEHKKYVLDPNSKDIRFVAKRIRLATRRPVVEPTGLKLSGWSQSDYAKLWVEFIRRFVDEMIMLPGWEYSVGCSREIATAFAADVNITTAEGEPISLPFTIYRLGIAVKELEKINFSSSINDVRQELSMLQHQRSIEGEVPIARSKRKDEALGELAKVANVAQVISLAPGSEEPVQQLCRVARAIAQSW